MSLLDRLVVRDRPPRNLVDPKVRDRLQRIPTGELGTWADNIVSQIGRDISTYYRDADPVQLSEAKMAAETLLALIEELDRRAT